MLESKPLKCIAILGDELRLSHFPVKRSSEQLFSLWLHPPTSGGPEAATEATALVRMDTHCDWKFLSDKALRLDDETRRDTPGQLFAFRPNVEGRN